MDLPPDLPIRRSIRCPNCGENIGMHLIKSSLTCPHCSCALQSNVERALREGLVLFFGLIIVWFVVRKNQGADLLDAFSVLTFIVFFYMGHLWYRFRLFLTKSILFHVESESDETK